MKSVLESFKLEMSNTIQNISKENFQQSKEKIGAYLNLIENYLTLSQDIAAVPDEPVAVAPIVLEEKKEVSIVEIEPVIEPEIEDEDKDDIEMEELNEQDKRMILDSTFKVQVVEKETEADKEPIIDQLTHSFDQAKAIKGFPFSRKLAGGFLLTDSVLHNIFVPEKVIREEGFEDGDCIGVELVGPETSTRPMYKYFMVEKNKYKMTSERRELNQAIVDYDVELKRFFVEKNVSKETIRIADTPVRLYISEKDTSDFNLSKGDIVDVAWYQNNFNKGKVVWKYSASATNSNESYIPQTLSGKRIMLLGGEEFKDEIESIVLSHGGSFFFIENSASKVRVSMNIRNANLVLVVPGKTNVEIANHAKQRAALTRTPFKGIVSKEPGFILASLYKALGLNKEQFDDVLL